MSDVKTLCDSYGVCRDVGCANCPNAKPKTSLAPGSNWPTYERPKEEKLEKLKRAYSPRMRKDKPLDTSLDLLKEARDFIAPLIKPECTTQLVRLYRDANGVVTGSEEVKGVHQATIAGANPYRGSFSIPFNEGFRAAERIYGITARKKRVG